MKMFTDNVGREWRVRLDSSAIRRVRRLLSIDLVEIANEPGLGRMSALFSDTPKLVDIVYAVCLPQAADRGLSDADFGRAMTGTDDPFGRVPSEIKDIPFARAAFAFAAALNELCRDAKTRAALRTSLSEHVKGIHV